MAGDFVSYLKTPPGSLRLLCVIFNFCGAISMTSAHFSGYFSQAKFYNFTAWSGFILSSIFFVIHGLNVPSRPDLRQHPWYPVETIYSAIWSFFFLVASCVVASKAGDFDVEYVDDHGAFVAAAVFGFFVFGVYLALTYFAWQYWRSPNQGDTIDSGFGEPPTLYDSGVSYQNMEQPPASHGFRPGTDSSLPAPHLVAEEQMMPIRSPGRSARLEFVD